MESVRKLTDIKAHLYPRQISERVREKLIPNRSNTRLEKENKDGGWLGLREEHGKHTHPLI